MNNITKLPANLINQIDREQIFEEFKERLSRLGDLKRARDEHEQRSWLGRWWHQSDLEEAQLDAQLLQADFAESLAKLMAINLVQSQQLEQQQNIIGLQQERLAEQNEKLKQQTESLDKQQFDLKKQGDELDDLVRNFFELKGLTEKEAKKLIEIANEVKGSKSEIYQRLEECVQELREDGVALGKSVGDVLSVAISEQKEVLIAAEAKFIRRYDLQETRLSTHIKVIETQNHEIGARLSEHGGAIATLDEKTIEVSHMQASLQGQVDEIRATVIAANHKMDEQFRQVMQRFWWSLGLGASSLIASLGSIIATYRLFG